MTQEITKLQVDLGERSYPILIGEEVWTELAQFVSEHYPHRRTIIVSDENVAALYGSQLQTSLANQGVDSQIFTMPAGEDHKHLAVVGQFYDQILSAGIDRKTPLLTLGGGVPGDVGGFVAATLLRGIPFIQIPTTLLAMVDSSVGGKTGFDTPQGKNLVGAFYQPRIVAVGLKTLTTLPKRELAAGLAEVIKYGVIRDWNFFEYLETNLAQLTNLSWPALQNVVQRCCAIKADVVSQDEREGGLREILNFGHTAGHAIETATNYGEWLHGEAVAVGMVVAARLGTKLHSGQPADIITRLEALLQQAGLPYRVPADLTAEQVWQIMHSDKKAQAGNIRMVLITGYGQVGTFDQIDFEVFAQAWAESGPKG